MYRKLAMLIVGSMVCIMAMPTPGQEGIVSQLYGNGVHAYFTGQYEEAYEFFCSAIQAGTRDPRIYYFRGLAYLKLGREEEAREDFTKGAELETADVNQLYPVGRALQRVQGNPRLLLEQYREKARLIALNRQRAVERARYEGIQQRQQAILQQQAEGAKTPPRMPPIEAPTPPPEKPAPPPFVEQPAEKLPGATKPEEKLEMKPEETPAEKPETKPEEKPEMKPEEEKPAEKPGASPFEMPGEKPAEEKPTEKPATKPILPSPFEEQTAEKPEMKPEEPPQPEPSEEKLEEKLENKPEEKPEMKPEEEKPAEKPGANPFEMPGEKPAEKASEEKPATNPFEEKPAKKPTAKPAMPSPFEEQPAEKPETKPEEKPEMKPEEKPETPEEKTEATPAEKPAEKSSGQAKSGGLLRGLWGAVRKTAEDATKPAGQTLEKVLPPGGGLAPAPGMPKLDAPVPTPFPGLPGMPGAEPGREKSKPEANPFEEEPASKPAGKPASDNPFAPAEKTSESAPEKPAEKVPLPKLPNPFE